MIVHIFGKELDISSCSILGRRNDNQDSFGWIAFTDHGAFSSSGPIEGFTEGRELFLGIVCDGMGGLKFGKEASRMLVDRTLDWIISAEKQSLDSLVKQYRDIILPSIEGEIMSLYEDSGTTLSMLLAMKDEWLSLHLGDSRLYAVGIDGAEFRTEDHSPVEAMRKAGMITEDEMEGHSMKNLISQYVGGGFANDLEVNGIDDWSRIVICSDGAYGSMPRERFFDLIKNNDAESIVHSCFESGSTDNITVISISR